MKKTIEKPTKISSVYTEEDKKNLFLCIDWLNQPKSINNQATLSRMAGVDVSTMHTIIKGKYPSPPRKQLERAIKAIREEKEEQPVPAITSIPFVETSVYRLVSSVCHRTHRYRDIGLVAGSPGTGKTIAIDQYCEEHPFSLRINASYNMGIGILLNQLVDMTNAVVHTANRYSGGTHAQKLISVIDALTGTDQLIIIDEADTMQPGSLEGLRRISDLASIGVVLAGEPKLHSMIKDRNGRFGRISSRVGFWPPVMRSITRADSDAITASGFSTDKIKLTEDINDAMWQVCEGSARTLSKLIPNVRDFGLKQGHKLTPALIFSVAAKTIDVRISERLKTKAS